jgi:amino acid adenylation domain-containing protein/FkbH-like protein
MRTAANPTLGEREQDLPATNGLPSANSELIPLSFAQQRLWFLEQLAPNTSLYNIPTLVRISGRLDLTILQRSLNAILARHEVLRSRIGFQEDSPKQIIAESESIEFRVLESENHSPDAIQQVLRDEMSRPFNLMHDRLIRALLVKVSAEEHWLAITMHHIVSDEWSLRIFFRELAQFYEAFVQNKTPLLPELSIQYADYAIWQREYLQPELLNEQLAYWKEQLKDAPPALELHADCARTTRASSRGGNVSRPFNNELEKLLRKVAQREGATLFMVLLAGLKVLLHRYTESEDIVVASPIAGRNQIQTENLIGFFVNTLALRTQVTGELTFREVLKRVKENTLGAYSHQDVPFEKVVEALHPERSAHHLHFTNLMFVLQQSMPEMQVGELTFSFPDVVGEHSKFELTVAVQESSRGLVARAEYNADLFEQRSVARLLEHFERVLTAVAAQPEQPIRQIPLLNKREFHRVVLDWNRTSSDYPRNQCVHQLFEAKACLEPKKAAVSFGKTSLSYHDLNTRANQLAHLLRRCHVGPEVPVAICINRSAEMVIGLLAILKAGGAYVPLDSSYPAERLEFMLADTGANILLTEQPLLSRLPEHVEKVICLDTDWELIAREPQDNLQNNATADTLAYITYTSGSTGQPKGVAVPHRAITRLVCNSNYVQLGKADRVAQISTLSFDASTFEIWGALLNGAELIGISTDVALSPQDFASELRVRQVSTMFLTTALFHQLAAEVPRAFSTLRTLMVGGEALDPKWTRQVLKYNPERLMNIYGPTENTTFSCFHLIKKVPETVTNVPIGKPIANTTAYILDRYMNPVPPGVRGTLYVGGDGLARGYWNQPQLTAEKFIKNPFVPGLLYNTGDQACYLEDGSIEFLGRKDGQVKIRGFRIELEEVEAALNQHDAIRECCVTASQDATGQKCLNAYFVTASDCMVNTSSLRNFLSDKLPQYMAPANFIQIPRLPLTANGKVDRKALPEFDQSRPELEKQYASPRDDVERELTRIWEQVLGVHPIGVDDKFFDLGGHSLLAVKLIAQIAKSFQRKLHLSAVFQSPTIAQMAGLIRGEVSKQAKTSTASSSIVEIQAKGTRPPLFLVHGAGGGMFWGYVNLSRHLGDSQPVYGFRSKGLDGQPEFERLDQMAAQYITDLRRIQPHGPYHLGGYCFGGNVAYEMARQLTAGGEEVGLLALINCAPPNSDYGQFRCTPKWLVRFLRNLWYWAGYCSQWSPAQRRDFLKWKLHMVRKNIHALLRIGRGESSRLEIENMVDLSSFSADQKQLWETHIRAQLRYNPQSFPGKVHLFRSPGHPIWCSYDPQYGWGELARGGVKITIVPAGHEKILEEPFVQVVAKGLNEILSAAKQPKAEVAHPTLSPEFIDSRSVPLRSLPLTNAHENRGVFERELGPSLSESLAYATKELAGAPELLEFPTTFSRPAQQSYRSRTEKLLLSQNLVQSLPGLVKRLRAEEFDFYGATVLVLLKRYIRQDECVMATHVAGGTEPFERVTGNFDDLVLIRTDLSGDPGFAEFLSRFRQKRETMMLHQRLPFEKLVEELHPATDQSFHPLAQVSFDFRRSSQETIHVERMQGTFKFDLSFQVLQQDGEVVLQIEYATDLFSPEAIGRLIQHWQRLIQSVANSREARLSELQMLTSAEENTLLKDWTDTYCACPRDKTLVDLFLEQVDRTPDSIALVSGTTRLSYRELSQRAAAVCDKISQERIGKEALVGICLERSWEMVAGILGTLQAGAAYVPMDPAYPSERLEFMVQDARMPVILTQKKLVTRLPHTQAKTIFVEELPCQSSHSATGRAETLEGNSVRPSANDLAYVIYTSGSTGKPKGVALEHKNAVAFVHWARTVFTPEELDGVLASTSICFDLSIFEMFVPLCSGGKVILAENALALPTLAAAHEVRLINTVPSAIRELLRARGIPGSVRIVNLAGEPLTTALVEQIYSESEVKKVYDLYGPTETTTYSTYVLRQPGRPATIGRPLANEQVYILDEQRQLVPVDVPGELFIGGDGLARGYLNRPELTAEKFVSHPFIPGARLYRTGDLARWREDGNLEYLGRIDHQVKIRGFRIELGEVEAALKKQSGVTDAVVVAREDPSGSKRLVAYVVTDRMRSTSQSDSDRSEELRRGLRAHLPEYMVPSTFVFLAAIPLTPNGKVDRKALPAPELEQRPSDTSEEVRTAVQEQVAEIWQEVFQIKRIGLQDNFFDLGGHSLLAFQIISRIRTKFKVELPLSGLFETPTIAALAAGLEGRRWEQGEVLKVGPTPIQRNGDLSVSFVQERLWFLDQLHPGSPAYNVPMALRLRGPIVREALQKALNKIVQRHETLRTTFSYSNGSISPVIAPFKPIVINVVHLEENKRAEKDARLKDELNQAAQVPFDLATGPLIRVTLMRLDETDHALLVVMHHTVTDGWSMALFFRELEIFYRAACNHSEAQISDLPIQYVDFVRWQRDSMSETRLAQELGYWQEKLRGAPARLELPGERSELAPPGDKAGRRTIELSREATEGISMLSHKGAGTPFMVLLAALGAALQKWTGQTDMVIGTVVAGRNHEAVENVIGCFMNFLPLRIKSNGNEAGEQLLSDVKATVLEAQSRQDCPFEKIVEAINPERSSNQNPLYNVGLLLQNFPAQIFGVESIESTPLPIELEAALLDLRFEAEQRGERYHLSCEYKTELFEQATIDELLASICRAVEWMAHQPQTRLNQLTLSSGLGEQAAKSPKKLALTMAIAATFTAEPIKESIGHWTKELSIPAKVLFAPYNQVFQQLLDPSSLLSTNQRGLNVLLLRLEDWQAAGSNMESGTDNIQRSAEELVLALQSTVARRSVPFLVCICPPSNKYTADSPQIKHLVRVERYLSAELENVAGVCFAPLEELWKYYPVSEYYDSAGDELGHVPYTPMFFTALGTWISRKFHALNRPPFKVIALDCDQTLWSGVCGEDGPDGIRLDPPRLALQRFMRAQQDAGMLLCLCSKNNEEDVLQVFEHHKEMPLCWENFVASRLNWQSKPDNLKALAEELKLGLDSFIFIDDNPVECAAVRDQCPEVVSLLLPEDTKLIPEFLHHCWVFDHVTKTSEDRTRVEMYQQNQKRQRFREQSVSLADFIQGLELQIDIEPATTEQLPRIAQLTQRTNQFNCTTRRRTEPELQTLLSTVETIRVTDRFGNYGVVGVIICNRQADAIEVDTFLLSCRVLGRGVEHQMLARLGQRAQQLGLSWVDVHYTPSGKNKPALEFLEKVGAPFRQALNGGYVFRFPAGTAAAVKFEPQNLEPTGRPEEHNPKPALSASAPVLWDSQQYQEIALKSLEVATIHEAIESKAARRNLQLSGQIPPRTDLERELCELWQKLLRIERVGIRDNFFELGGHSLLAVRLFAEVEKLTQRKLPLVTLFQAPTVEALAGILGQQAQDRSPSLLVPIQPQTGRAPLFLVHGAGGDVLWGYANLAAHLSKEQPVYGIKSRGQAGLEEWPTLEEMATGYLREVQALQPAGPYYLGGYCFGGNVAYEMARQLHAQGETVALLALLDSAPTNAGYETVPWWRPSYSWHFAKNVYYWCSDFSQLDRNSKLRFMTRKARTWGRKAAGLVRGDKSRDSFDIEDVIDPKLFPENELRLWHIHLRALTEHVQKPYAGSAMLFRTRGQPVFSSLAEDFCWGKLVSGGVEVKHVPGSHENVFVEPNVQQLAQELSNALAKTRSSSEGATMALHRAPSDTAKSAVEFVHS